MEEVEIIGRPSMCPRELRGRAVRAIVESLAAGEYQSEFEAIKSVSRKIGIKSSETLRRWVRQAEIDAGAKKGKTTAELAEIRELKKEVPELRRANEILKTASAFFATELDRPSGF